MTSALQLPSALWETGIFSHFGAMLPKEGASLSFQTRAPPGYMFA